MNIGGVNIFVSSTCYDLSQVRKDLKDFILSLGHNPILSEQNDFPIDPQLDNWENCINAVKKYADIFILIIGNKYGQVREDGKSITNTEYLTAIQKGIPVYTFALKQMTALLPMWERNQNADFSNVVDNNKIFEFLSLVRKESGKWNFEFESVEDIKDTLQKQLSILFHDSLKYRARMVSTPYEDLYLKISSKALGIIMQKEDNYDIKFFMQVMLDGINAYRPLRNDYNYSIILKPIQEKRNLKEFTFWLNDKFNELTGYIDSLHRLSDTLKEFYKENDDESDLYGLHYVASTIAEFYANLLRWGISVKAMIIPEECNKFKEVLSKMPSYIIDQMEKYPVEAMERISVYNNKTKKGTVEEDDLIVFPFEIIIPKDIMSEFNKSLEDLNGLITRLQRNRKKGKTQRE